MYPDDPAPRLLRSGCHGHPIEPSFCRLILPVADQITGDARRVIVRRRCLVRAVSPHRRQRLLKRDGEPVAGQRAFDVLLALVGNAGESSALRNQARVWPGVCRRGKSEVHRRATQASTTPGRLALSHYNSRPRLLRRRSSTRRAA